MDSATLPALSDVPLLSGATLLRPFGALLAQGETAAAVSPALTLTIASAISAIALAVLMRPGPRGVRVAATVAGLAAFAILVVEVLKRAGADGTPETALPMIFPVVFACIGLAGAVRMITHPRPVFAALYFILVVIATAGMFLLLGAEFMAFALIIVYAGAILITYMFVLMLAQQSPTEQEGSAWYDRVPREAGSAVLLGFVMLASLSEAYFSQSGQAFRDDASERTAAIGEREAWQRLDAMPKLMRETAQAALTAEWKALAKEGPVPDVTELVRDSVGSSLRISGDSVAVEVKLAGEDGAALVSLSPEFLPDNGRQVGVDLVSKYPAGLEIAGVVLLMALFGAVILARKQIELGEDERRTLAGMRRFTVEGEAGGTGGGR